MRRTSFGLVVLGLVVVACGDQAPPSSHENIGRVASRFGVPCGAGTAGLVGNDGICVYTTVGAFTGVNGFTPPAGVTRVQAVVVAGGGGGGEGGGGGGGTLYQSAIAVTPGVAVDITVGDGGASNNTGAPGVTGAGQSGGDSAFGAVVAFGGGGGGAYRTKGADGGSGGGSGCDDVYTTGSTGTFLHGFGGGVSSAPGYGGSGGGGGSNGPGAIGGPTPSAPGQNPTIGGNGGPGKPMSIRGFREYFGGGGGGGVNTNSTPALGGGLGGIGGGGNGARDGFSSSTPDAPQYSAQPNTGGGGGGGDCEGYGGRGGSGIVIVRWGTCENDSDCGSAEWCNTGASPRACEADLANGAAIPTIPSHTNPVLDGTCTPAVGAAVCAAKTCGSDNACGQLTGQQCAADSECRSGVCDGTAGVCRQCMPGKASACTGATPICDTATFTCTACNGDNGTAATAKCSLEAPYCPGGGAACGTCGAAAGTATCTAAGATHAGGICSSSGACSNACSIDTHCTAGQWCDPATSACLPDIANGERIPTVNGHNPQLNGTCSAAAAAAVCASGVCDFADGRCGYADGSGTCTPANAETVCRGGKCSLEGKCVGAEGCVVDGDCAASSYCNKALTPSTCAAKKTSDSACATAIECLSAACNDQKCATGCTAATDCPADTYCDAASTLKICQAKKANGAACATPAECTSNACTNGLCGTPPAPTPTGTGTTPVPTPTQPPTSPAPTGATSSGGATSTDDSGCAQTRTTRSTSTSGVVFMAALAMLTFVKRRRRA